MLLTLHTISLCWFRQKQHLGQLEQRLRDSELHLLGRGTSYSDMCMLRLQVSGVMNHKFFFFLPSFFNCFQKKLLLSPPETCDLNVLPHVSSSQEAQRENVFLRAQFAERTDCAALEKAEAERRLGAVEAETRRLTESLKESTERHQEEMKKQEERVGASNPST